MPFLLENKVLSYFFMPEHRTTDQIYTPLTLVDSYVHNSTTGEIFSWNRRETCMLVKLLVKMHCRGALEAGTAKTLMANDQIRHSTANSFMLRMSCIVKL